jgi:hypothetical protein
MPPIHVLILPSKIPLDLRQHFRDLDDEHVVRRRGAIFLMTDTAPFQNGTFQPDHMNLLELSEALADVGRAHSFFPYPGLINFPTYSLRLYGGRRRV